MTSQPKNTTRKNNSLAAHANDLVVNEVSNPIPPMPPSSAENEQALLGALLIGEKEIGFEVYPLVRADDFYFEKHRWIYEAILALSARKDDVDFLTVVTELEKQGRLTDVGGPAYITSLINATPMIFNAKTYANTIRDLAGRRQMIYVATKLSELGFLGTAPFPELLSQANAAMAMLSNGYLTNQAVSMAQVMEATITRIDEAHQNPKDVWGIATKFDLDRVTGGLHRKELLVLSGDPGIGKTSFMLDVAVNAAQEDTRLRQVMFSLEMSWQELGMRWVSNRTQVNSQTLKRGRASSDDLARVVQQAGVLSELNIQVYDMPMDTATIDAMVAREQYLHGCDLVTVDYSKMVTERRGELTENESLRLGRIAADLKRIAKMRNVAVVLIHPSNRAASLQNRQPVLADLGWSGDVAYHADTVIFLWKMAGEPLTQFIATTPEWDGKLTPIQAIIAKGRNGPTIPVELLFDGATTRWLNPVRSHL